MLERIRKIAILTLFCFCWGILAPSLLPAQDRNGLDEARKLYEEGRPDKARAVLDGLITQWTDRPGLNKLLAEAYFLRARIFLEMLEKVSADDDLHQVFVQQPDFSVPTADPELKVLAERIRAEVAQKSQEELKKAQELLKQEAERKALEIKAQTETQLQKEEQERLEKEREASEEQQRQEGAKLVEAQKKATEQLQVDVQKKEAEPVVEKETVKIELAQPIVLEKEKLAPQLKKKKKKIPWLLVGLGAVVVGVAIYFLVIKKPKYTLTINLGTETTGTPAGTAKYKKGTVVNYNYTPQAGYGSLLVKLDGVAVAASGTFKMDKDRTLDVSATQQYTLTVNLGTGTTGTPAATASYDKDQVVNYSYTAQAGYGSLQVKLDGVAVAASGTVNMDKDHTLDVSATQQYTLTVNLGTGTTGTPSATASYDKDQVVNYSYTAQAGYGNLQVKLDGVAVAASGTVNMDKDHTLDVSKQYTLTVNLGTGTTGTPADTAIYNKDQVVNYSYTAQAEYGSLLVKLDGVAVAVSGTVNMDKDHTLDVSAVQQYILTVNLGTGTTGTPSATASYDKNQVVNYSYTAQAGYGSLQVKLDGVLVPNKGTVKMDKDHTLNVSAVQQYTLTVNRDNGTTGTPEATASYNKDQVVNYNYTVQAGYSNLLVKLDGVTVAASGTVDMDKDRTLDVFATRQYTLTVNRGTGTTGTPSATASYDKDQVVNYSYTAQAGYKSLQVKLDGVAVAASGTVKMNKDHTLSVSAIIIYAFYVAMGDSITYGTLLSNHSDCYPNVLSGMLGKPVVNEGRPGEQARQGLARFAGVLYAYKPSHILILYGVNDLANGRGPDNIKSDLRQMIALARANNTVPVIATMTPAIGLASWLAYEVALTSAAIRQLGAEQGVGVADLAAAFNNRADLMSYDGLHPNAAGHRLMATTFYNLLNR